MSEELLKKFYTKIVRLLKSKPGATEPSISPNLLDAFKDYADKGLLSDALLKLGLTDIHSLIEALRGDQKQDMIIDKIETSPIFLDYLEESLPLLESRLKDIEQYATPMPVRECMTLIHKQLELWQKMVAGVKQNNVFPIMHSLIDVYPSQPLALRKVVASSLKKVGRPVVLALIHSLYQEKGEKHSELPELLKEMGYLAVPALIVALHYPEEKVRYGASDVLKKMKAREAVPALVEAFQDPSWKVRKAVAEALGEIGSPRAVPGLIKALQDAHPTVRLEVAKTLGKLKGNDVVNALLKLLDDPSWEVRREVVEAMAKFGPSASASLAKALENNSLVVRKIASRVLAEIGTEDAVPALMKAIYDKDISVRERVVFALGRIQKDDSIVTLMYALEDKAPLVRFAAIQVLINVGTRGTLHLLNKALKDPEQIIRQRANVAIQEILKREDNKKEASKK